LCVAGLLLLVFVGFFPALSSSFVQWDDTVLVVRNPFLNPPRVAGVMHFWTQAHEGLYTPLAYTLWSVAAAVRTPAEAPDRAAPLFHGLNVALHALAVAGALALLLRLSGGKAAAAFAGAVVFALHPLQVEPVTWVSGMNNVLAGAAGVWALWAYVGHATAPDRPTAGRRYAVASVCFALALLSKPTAVILPLLAIVIDRVLIGRAWRQVGRAVVPWIVAASAFGVVARLAQPATDAPPVDPLFRPVVALDALAFYAGKLVAPVRLSIDYGRTPDWLAASPQRFWTWSVPVVFAVVAVLLRRPMPELGAGAAIFALGLLPVLGLTPFDFQAYSTVADRYAYLPLLGVGIAIAGVAARCRPAVVCGVAVPVALGLAMACFNLAVQWSDTPSLLGRTLSVNPTSLMANRNLAAMYLDQGKTDAALQFGRRAVQYHPGSADARKNLAAVLAARGDLVGAREEYRKAVTLRPGDPAAHYGLAAVLAQSGMTPEALEHAETAVRLNPLDPQARLNFATVLAQGGRTAEAIDEFEAALRLAPNDVRALTNFAVLHAATGRRDEAMRLLSRVLEIDPQFAPARALLHELQSVPPRS
jgi:tetratricopeptide (TPR) repeat protein